MPDLGARNKGKEPVFFFFEDLPAYLLEFVDASRTLSRIF